MQAGTGTGNSHTHFLAGQGSATHTHLQLVIDHLVIKLIRVAVPGLNAYSRCKIVRLNIQLLSHACPAVVLFSAGNLLLEGHSLYVSLTAQDADENVTKKNNKKDIKDTWKVRFI